MSRTEGKRQEKQAPSSDAALLARLAQLERKVDALCRYLLPPAGRHAAPDVPPVRLVKSAE